MKNHVIKCMNHLYLQHSTQDHQVKEILTKVELQEFFIHKYLMRFSPQGAILCVCLQCVSECPYVLDVCSCCHQQAWLVRTEFHAE